MIDSIYVINSAGSKPHSIADKFAIFCGLSSMLAENENLFFTEDMNFQLTKTAVDTYLADLIANYDRKKDFFASVESCCIKIDENHFNMMIREIVENAIKYSKPDDVIVIHGFKEKKVYRLTINGIGRGMSNEEIQKAVSFEDFNEKTNSHNGLGFYIVKLILKLFNGEIKIRSKENKYTMVEISLPLADSASDSNNFEKKMIFNSIRKMR